jgi:mitochondrial division protein 1
MTLASHSAPITALDFSEPYGLLVTASQDESTRLWDLTSGEEIAFLRGHTGSCRRFPPQSVIHLFTGVVKCLQVEGDACVSGGSDSTIRIWDLRAVEEEEEALNQSFAGSSASSPRSTLPSIPDGDADEEEDAAVFVERPRSRATPRSRPQGCIRTLEGHSKAVSSLYFEDSCLVSGASDKTIRQWDINTGQCVLTMDILWAISHPHPQPRSSSNSQSSRGAAFTVPGLPGASLLSAASNTFSFPSPPSADGSWDMYLDFVGGVQFWGYALVSGSGDGAVRMWDSKQTCIPAL